ncbi:MULTISPECIES: hypothetical protein, partial [unclassified Bradyrhizobium]|uniref:hypothetical protein n=1 Tax=unclassified Bradyrhizobium TaxID=2631580 RepID=UPI001FF76DE4
KKESTGLRLNRLCPPYVTPSSISSFGRRPSSAHIAESKSLKNSGENTFCQSSAKLSDIIFSLPRPAPQRSLRLQPADNMRATKSVGGD